MEVRSSVVVLLLLVYILLLHCVAIFLFTSGFLLTRTELPDLSLCGDAIEAPCGGSDASCWSDPGVGRVIIVLIDALRFDFLAKSEHFSGEIRPWMNKLPVLQRLAESEKGRVFKYIADPPTTTLQRLKGLTTGGLPTFVDVGNSFGAPAIVEDNIIYQLASNGKRVVMMGDDTWMELFPTQFSQAFPFPSFNVKDLHTVDNGVKANIFPKLKEDDWDVLIAHFLGVDHVGHIFGVESPLMVEKLQEYNNVIEEVISVLESDTRHENTLLVVMGDHGQTLHGDHGGGSPEEVETGLFATVIGKRAGFPPAELRLSPCNGNASSSCISTLPQLEFAATLATLLGIPIPFGSVGRVNAELFSLAWPSEPSFAWLERYRNILCINSWQVKRYLDQYAARAHKGIPASELARLTKLYEACGEKNNDPAASETRLQEQISHYNHFLTEAAALARSQWTRFGDLKMALGLLLLVFSIPVQAAALQRVSSLRKSSDSLQFIFPAKMMAISSLAALLILGILLASTAIVSLSHRDSSAISPFLEHLEYLALGALAFGSMYGYLKNSSGKLASSSTSWWSYSRDSKTIAGIFFVLLHALSLLSNSFIMAEGHVASFLLGTIGMIYLRYAIQSKSKILQAIIFLVSNRILSGIGLSSIVKDTIETGSQTASGFAQISRRLDLLLYVAPLVLFSWLTIRHLMRRKPSKEMNLCQVATLCAPIANTIIVAHWLASDLSDMNLITLPEALKEFIRLQLPRFVYTSTLFSTGILYLAAKTSSGKSIHLSDAVIAFFGSWSGSVMLLLGRKAPFVGFLALLQVWSISELQSLSSAEQSRPFFALWNFLALLIFFCTNHRCTFDGLRYPAAFIGFDDFNLYRQGALLAIDTYGASHILPIIGLPFLLKGGVDESKPMHGVSDIASAYLSFGLVRSITTTFSTICVTIQRRHLMVWGLFAPKFVFDAIGLLFTDALFVAAATLYFSFL